MELNKLVRLLINWNVPQIDPNLAQRSSMFQTQHVLNENTFLFL